MGANLRQTQRQTQDLRFTLQLQQAIKLLQLNLPEMLELVQQELVENPFLEESTEGGDVPAGGEASTIDQVSDVGEPDASEPLKADNLEKAIAEIDWDSYVDNFSAPLPGGASASTSDDEQQPFERANDNAESLTARLLFQLQTSGASAEVKLAAAAVIHNLDENGYLVDVTIEELAEEQSVSTDAVEEGLTLVQSFDPAGVAARDLRECLMLQAKAAGETDLVLLEIIEHHLHDIERQNYAAISRALAVPRDRVATAHKRLLKFDPKPGRQFTPDDGGNYIIPDIFIEKIGAIWHARLNEEGLPRLRVSDDYRRQMGRNAAKEDKNYAAERIHSARWLIKSIDQRQRTIRRVTEAILKFQRGFLDHGVDHLRPLVLKDVAEEIGVHESTVSRVTSNKYVETPRGTFELKYFFDSSVRQSGGDDVAAEAVKHHIRALIQQEPNAKPLSDDKLADLLLAKFNIEVARRTVAKYREAMGILPSARRKRRG